MSGDKQHLNGSGPTRNGVNGADDVEMKDGSQNAKKGTKGSKDKEGDSDMTVVVPPSKGSNTPSAPSKATEADLTNGDVDGDGEKVAEEPVDPQEKAIEGKATCFQDSVSEPLY
jgi:26S proteasome regulatory subunit N3